VKLHRDGDRPLQLLVFNEEFLVSASHQLALITSLPFVHTARRYYRLNGLVRPWDSGVLETGPSGKLGQTWSFRGSKSRNKVSVGEPAEGSLPIQGSTAGVYALARRLVEYSSHVNNVFREGWLLPLRTRPQGCRSRGALVAAAAYSPHLFTPTPL
jgi:hypothetical protein